MDLVIGFAAASSLDDCTSSDEALALIVDAASGLLLLTPSRLDIKPVVDDFGMVLADSGDSKAESSSLSAFSGLIT